MLYLFYKPVSILDMIMVASSFAAAVLQQRGILFKAVLESSRGSGIASRVGCLYAILFTALVKWIVEGAISSP